MKFYQLALRYLRRKKSKTFLLFFVLLLVNTMLLSICMILRATEDSMRSMQAKTSSKIIAEVSDVNAGITDTEAEQIRKSAGRRLRKPDRTDMKHSRPASHRLLQVLLQRKITGKQPCCPMTIWKRTVPFSELQYHLTSGKLYK